MNEAELAKNGFHKYVSTPPTVYMREIYSGMYVSWCTKERCFRIMPDWARRGFPGIILPHRTYREVVMMVQAMGGSWEWREHFPDPSCAPGETLCDYPRDTEGACG